MNWRKRKKFRKILRNYGIKHAWQYQKWMKAGIKTVESRYIVNHPNEFYWRTVLRAYNKICDEFDVPEKKMTETEYLIKVKNYTYQMVKTKEEYEDDVIREFLDDVIRKQQISASYNVDLMRHHVAGGKDFDGDTFGVFPIKSIPDYENMKAEDD